jgi:hypothetical protein
MKSRIWIGFIYDAPDDPEIYPSFLAGRGLLECQNERIYPTLTFEGQQFIDGLP